MPEITPKIFLFSRPIRSGKTTELGAAFSGKKGVGGFLTPDRNGQRMFYDLAKNAWQPFEVAETAGAVSIGKFHFAAAAFDDAKTLFKEDFPVFILDEVGKLEVLENRGLEPELSGFIADYLSGKKRGILLLVVRDSLLESAIQKYGLGNAPVISSLENAGSFFG